MRISDWSSDVCASDLGVPPWARWPMIALATAATVIASQAVITGAFSISRQAMQLGYIPRMAIRHTSSETIGQIYIPGINWMLAVLVIGLVLAFGSSSALPRSEERRVGTEWVDK